MADWLASNTDNGDFGDRATLDPSEDEGGDEAAFSRLLAQWNNQRAFISSITEMSMCAAYQNIIGMGPSAVPLILKQLRSEGDQPDQWFWALRAITQANPVPPSERGNFRLMARRWLEWGRANRYVE